MNKIDKNDPRVTAYALGEPVDADFEAQLNADAALMAEVDAIRATAGLLGATFASEAAVGLTETQREDVLREATVETVVPAQGKVIQFRLSESLVRHRYAAMGLAAVLVLGLGAFLGAGELFNPMRGAMVEESGDMAMGYESPYMPSQLAEATALALGLGSAMSIVQPDNASVSGAAAAATAEPVPALSQALQPSAAAADGKGSPPRAVMRGAPAAALPADSGGAGDSPTDADSEGWRRREPVEPYPYTSWPAPPNTNTESYAPITDNPFTAVAAEPLSTFSVDVDTASYANVRRFLTDGQLPPPDAVRIEELLNYFRYNYPQPRGDDPFAADIAVANAPWAPEHRLVRVGLKGREVPASARTASNLVFLVDVSGSMDEPDKLPLVQTALRGLVSQLDGRDKVAIVVYAGNSGLVLEPTSGSDSWTILGAIDRLDAGGSTNGGEGIQLAYELARRNFIRGGTNRVILATDGDFNVGITDQDSLVRLIEEEARSGVFLSVLGFGTGNLKDSTMELLADKGNGNYAYIDGVAEARKVLGEQLAGTLMTIAKDVKAQLEFNPALVSAYRLIGYENRVLAAEDFNNDAKDAGDIGSGHTVTALYEVVPTGVAIGAPGTDPLRYQQPTTPSPGVNNGELLTLKLRYKAPDGQTSKLLTFPVKDSRTTIDRANGDFQFAAAVAAFGMLLRNSPYSGSASYDMVRQLANRGATQVDDSNERASRAEFLQLVDRAWGMRGGE